MGNRISTWTRRNINKLKTNSQAGIHALATLSLVFASTFGVAGPVMANQGNNPSIGIALVNNLTTPISESDNAALDVDVVTSGNSTWGSTQILLDGSEHECVEVIDANTSEVPFSNPGPGKYDVSVVAYGGPGNSSNSTCHSSGKSALSSGDPTPAGELEVTEQINPQELPKERISEGTTTVSDVMFSKEDGVANIDLRFTLDENGYITGDAKDDLDAQVPAVGGNLGYHEVRAERPDESITHVNFEWLTGGISELGKNYTLNNGIRPYIPVAQKSTEGNWTPVDGTTYEFNIEWYEGNPILRHIETLDVNITNNSAEENIDELIANCSAASIDKEAGGGDQYWGILFDNFLPTDADRIFWQRTDGSIVEVPHSNTDRLYLNKSEESNGTINVYYLFGDDCKVATAQYDSVGNLAKVNDWIINDSEAPSAALLSPAENTFASGVIDVTFEHVDEISGVQKSYFNIMDAEGDKVDVNGKTTFQLEDQGNNEWTYLSLDTKQLKDGEYTLTTRPMDNAGNARYYRDFALNIDNTKPTHTIDTHSNGDFVNGEFTLEGTASDNLSGIKEVTVQVNEIEEVGCSSCHVSTEQSRQKANYENGKWEFNADTTSFADGVYRFHVNSVDNAGNERFAPNVDLIVDNTNPNVPENLRTTNSSASCGEATNSSDVTVSWGASTDNVGVSHYEYWIVTPQRTEGSAWVTEVSGTSRDGTFNEGEGEYVIKVRAVDHAGNKSAWSEPCSLTYDSTDPTFDVTPDDQTLNTGENATLEIVNLDAGASGQDTYLWEVVESGATIVNDINDQESVTITSDTAGTYTVELTVTDKAGNAHTEFATVTFTNPVFIPDTSQDLDADTETTPDTTTTDDDTQPPAAPLATGIPGTIGGPTGDSDATEEEETETEEDTGDVGGGDFDANGDDDAEDVLAETDENLISWWWLILLLVLAVAGYLYYRSRQSGRRA